MAENSMQLNQHLINIFSLTSKEKRNKAANNRLLVFLKTEGDKVSPSNRRITKIIFRFSTVKIEIFIFILFFAQKALTGLINSRPFIIFRETLSKLFYVNLKHMLFVRVEGVDPMLITIIKISLYV